MTHRPVEARVLKAHSNSFGTKLEKDPGDIYSLPYAQFIMLEAQDLLERAKKDPVTK